MQWINKLSFHIILLASSFFIVAIIFLHYIFPYILGSPGGAFPGGESLSVHIAIAKSILNGTFLHPAYRDQRLYPASNELLLAAVLFSKIPVNLFNLFGILALFTTSIYTGKAFNLTRIYTLFFSLSLCTIYGVLRYALSQQIDIWLLNWFLLTLALLSKPKANALYFLFLGFSSGMLLGSRFTAPATLLTLFIFYYRNFFKYLNVKRFLVFVSLVSILGGFWYIRNFIVTGDPFYPQPFLMFKGACITECSYLSYNVLTSLIFHPNLIINVFISEYMIWSISFVILPCFFIFTFFKKKTKQFTVFNKLILLGLTNFLIFLFFPSASWYDGVVSSIRYSYPVFGTFMLSLFLLADQLHYEDLLEIITFANLSFLVISFSYHPKFLFLYVPVVTLFIYFLHRYIKRRLLKLS